jgi:predicted AAA+ superfamily ATPase
MTFLPYVLERREKQLSLNSNLAQIVIGVRRSGKSTICEKYLRQNHVNFAYVNFDDDRLSSLKTEDFDIVLDALYQLYGDFKYLFLDEVQNIADWQLFINRLLRQKIHLFVTGSNSKLLSTELTTHLTGRHTKIELYPFSFREYGTMKKVELNSLSTKAVALRKKALSNDYLIEGGFPELLNETNKRGYIETLLNSIIKNDIARPVPNQVCGCVEKTGSISFR